MSILTVRFGKKEKKTLVIEKGNEINVKAKECKSYIIIKRGLIIHLLNRLKINGSA